MKFTPIHGRDAMKLHFFKLDGAGNDFVGLDFRTAPLPPTGDLGDLARRLCHRQRGVGADGVLCILPPQTGGFHFRMLYLNADGSVGEMCGNGARCAVVLAHHLGMTPEEGILFDTDAGPHRADLAPGGSAVHFPDIPALPRRENLLGVARPVETALFLTCGVPHAVVFVDDDLDMIDVVADGRAMRHDPAFAPAGTNANFARETSPGHLDLRTYERGVEVETLACGTGSVATCACRAHLNGILGPSKWTVVPTGGEALSITLNATDTGFTNITLAGPARIVFTGEFPLAGHA
jgi:diaminopimelate epimerase